VSETSTLPAPPSGAEDDKIDGEFQELADRLAKTPLPEGLVPARDILFVERGCSNVVCAPRELFLVRYGDILEKYGWLSAAKELLEAIAAEMPSTPPGSLPALIIVGDHMRLAWLVVRRAGPSKKQEKRYAALTRRVLS
jgi:hypothetical protein